MMNTISGNTDAFSCMQIKLFMYSLVLRRFVFLIVEASAKREWLVMNRKGPWEGYRRLRAHFHRERERRLGTKQVHLYKTELCWLLD